MGTPAALNNLSRLTFVDTSAPQVLSQVARSPNQELKDYNKILAVEFCEAVYKYFFYYFF